MRFPTIATLTAILAAIAQADSIIKTAEVYFIGAGGPEATYIYLIPLDDGSHPISRPSS
jgi:hypothetical protein